MSNLPTRLIRLGDALEAAATADLRRRGASAPMTASGPPRRRGLRVPRRVAVIAVALVVLVPGAAVAANSLFGPAEVAAGLPAGTLALAGTEPTCTEVRAEVEYHCTLAKPPSDEVADWKGTVEPTVGADEVINGGCRSLASDGREWECYLGEAAVEEQIIGPQLLGARSEGPGVG
jgi:hypothetical protein